MAYSLSECLNAVGVDSSAYCTRQPHFDYPEHAIVTQSPEELEPVLEKADTIVFMHSCPKLLEIPFDFRKKRCVVFHGGSEYREKPDFINELFNPLVDISLTQTGSLLNLGAKNEKWLLPPIDTASL